MKRIITSLIIALAFTQVSFAQQLNPKEIKLAENLLRSGNYESALLIFRKHYKSGNNSTKVINGISNSLRELNNYQEWIRFLDEVLLKLPQSFNYRIDLGKAYYLNKQPDRALEIWHKVYEKDPPHLMRHRLTAQAMASFRLFDEAIEVYKRAMAKLANQDVVHLDIGTLYKLQLNYEMATEHYVAYFRKFKKQRNYVRSMLIGMAKDDDASDRIIQSLEILNNDNDPDLNELLTNLYIRKKDYPKALQIVLEIESKTKDDKFIYLNRFAREAEKDRAYIYVIEAYEFMLDNTKKIITASIEYKLARAYYANGKNLFKDQKFDEADDQIKKGLNILEQLFDKNTHEKYKAAEAIGDINKSHFSDFDGAYEYYSKVPLNKVGINDADRVRIKLADIYLLKNDLLRAQEVYAQVKSKKFLSFAAFNLAEIDYYTGQFSRAKNKYNSLISSIGMKDSLANNALDRTFDIDLFSSDSLTFSKYTQAVLLKRQQKYSEAAKQFAEIYNVNNMMSLKAGMLVVNLYNLLEKPLDAINLLEDIVKTYPDGQQTDRAYYLLATGYEKTSKFDKALSLYQEILIRFPTSFYSEQARANARTLNELLQEKSNQ
ncbi:MAG: hypothetical protein D8M58_10730 [Calditrichaeota bacterium]|nr:MAG: hypothetical protein DWQ03_10105 [Calditrichota bacterium]MBL1205866.1 hypothetical protein [Calditrichota bacterium]NOG45694.1 tetratricopeptide repeat protein [Calditrichota bacterium]